MTIVQAANAATSQTERAIIEYIETANENPKPLRRHKTADETLASTKRCCLRTMETANATLPRIFLARTPWPAVGSCSARLLQTRCRNRYICITCKCQFWPRPLLSVNHP